MLKIKSKALLAFTGLMVAFTLIAGANIASADTIVLPASGVSRASGSAVVMNLQLFLNWNLNGQITPLVVDGKYGAKTTAAIKLFQANNGLVADGIFGRMSAAKAATLQASNPGNGCPAGAMFNPATGAPCTSVPAPTNGCPAGAMFNPMTGASCAGSVVTPTGTNGYLTDFAADSTNRVSTVYESEANKVVAGFRATARLSSQTVNRVRVTFTNTNGSSSANLAKYISGATLWYGSQAIATLPVASADRATSSDVYTFNFSGLNAVIPKDQIGRFYVSVNANGSIDTNDTAATWTVTFTAGGVMATSPDGSSDTYPSSDIATTNIGFGKFVSNGVKATVALSSNNPTASTIAVSSTATTNNVTLLKFTIKATNSDLVVRKIPVQVSSTTASVASMINTLKLYNGSNLVDSVDGSTRYEVTGGQIDIDDTTIGTTTTVGYVFGNLSDPYNRIAAGTTAEFTVVADLKAANGTNYSAGDTLTASLVNADVVSGTDLVLSINDANGDQLTRTSTYRVGSAVGSIQTLRVNGVNTVMGTPTYSNTVDSNGAITSVTYNIPVSVTAFGDTLYIGQTAQLNSTATGSNAFAVVFQTSAAPSSDETTSSASLAVSSTDATVESNGYRLDSGVTKHFTITVNLTTPSSVNSNYRVALKQIRTFTEGLLLNGTSSNLLPVEQFRTDYKLINS